MLSFLPAHKNMIMGLQDQAGGGWRAVRSVKLHSSCSYSYLSLISPPLQTFCELPLIQAVLQPVQTHGRTGGAGAQYPAEESCTQSHECHQHTGGEPRQLRQGGVRAEAGRNSPRTPTQGGACVLQGKVSVNKKDVRRTIMPYTWRCWRCVGKIISIAAWFDCWYDF